MAVYDAFVSYSHAKDKPIAAALQSVIQTLGKPWYRRRALRVFRDDTSLSATPSLWPSIEQALGNSRFLILLASPEAAASHWVNKEVSYWLDNKGADTLLIALTDGELSWDNAIGDFVRREGRPLPPVLTGRFATEPKWVDLRAYRDGADARDSRFIEAGADFAAAVHGMPKEDLLSQEVRQQRRALRLAWSAAGSLLILAGIAGWQAKVALDNERVAIEQRNIAEQQRRLAQEQRDRAERNLAAATKTANSLVFGLAREFRDRTGMPRDLVRRVLDRAQFLQRQLVDSDETAPALRRSEAAALDELASTYLALGDTARALASIRRARTIIEQLLATDPRNAGWQRDMLLVHMRVGDVLLKVGRREEALAEYRRGLAISEAIAAADPDNREAQRDLAVSQERIADVLMEAGQRNEALTAYRRSLAIREELAVADPRKTGWQRDLSIGHERIGDVLMAAGQRAEALAAYRRSLAIHEKLAAGDRGNTEWQRDLSAIHDRIGDILMAAGQPPEALAVYLRSLAIRKTLAAADRGNTEWQRSLSFSYVKLGEVLMAAGQREGALAYYRRGLAIRETLALTDRGNMGWQVDLAFGLYKVSSASEPADARALLRRAITIADTLAKAGTLSADQQNWPQVFRAALAKLPPERAKARWGPVAPPIAFPPPPGHNPPP